jgi:thioesterase domain-containing protein
MSNAIAKASAYRSHRLTASFLTDLARMGVLVSRDNDTIRTDVPAGAQIGRLAEEIKQNQSALLDMCRAESGDVPLHPLSSGVNSQINVVCVHAIDGGVYSYRHVVEHFSEQYSVYGLQALHWINEDDAPRGVEQMAERYCTYVSCGLPDDKPLVLYGPSSGGLIALEMAQRLSSRGKPPALLVLGDTRDHLQPRTSAMNLLFERLLWTGFLTLYAPLELLDVLPPSHEFWTLGEDARFAYIVQRTLRLPAPRYLIPMTVDSLRRHLGLFRRYYRSYAGYEPEPYFGRSLYIIGSAVNGVYSKELRGKLVGQAREAQVTGGHTALFEPPGTARVAELIQAEVELLRTARMRA